MEKLSPLPVKMGTLEGTLSCSKRSWYSCHTQPMYTPVALGGTAAPVARASCTHRGEIHRCANPVFWH